MAQGLSVSRVVDVQVNFAPQAVPTQRFDTLLIMGDSGVIDTGEAIREYNSINDVAQDFGTTAPEYQAAVLFFSQLPQPNTCFIGAWALTATHGRLTGGLLTAVEQLMASWTAITNGGFSVALDGQTAVQVSSLNFSSATNLNNVANTIQTALRTAASQPQLTFIWNGDQFVCQSGTSGTTSQVAYFGAPTGGSTDISAQLKMTAATAIRSNAGMASETPVASLVRVDGRGWYAATFAASRTLTDAEHIACSAYIEAAADKHMYGITTNVATALDPANTTDLGSSIVYRPRKVQRG